MFDFLQGRLIWVRICLLVCTLLLVTIGIVTIYAVGNPAEASPGSQATDWAGQYKKQIVFAVIGLFGFVAVNFVSYREFGVYSHWIYGGVLILLAYLIASRFATPRFGSLPFAPSGRDFVFRWIVLHDSLPRIQPSEFCKLAYIITLAWYLRFRSNYQSIKALVGPFLLTLLPMMLILPEPDLGTVVLLMPVLFAMLFLAGARAKHLLIVILMGIAVSPLVWLNMQWYQRIRISVLMVQNTWVREQVLTNPTWAKVLVGRTTDVARLIDDKEYQLIRSKIAIASGGMTGHGFRRGDVIKYKFLPEAHNDFIFAAIMHQWGFLGALVVLGLYGMIVLCGMEIASHNTDPFGRLVAMGILTMIVFEVFVNVGMTMGLMPITGLTLPLVSYGGSSLLVSLMAIGLLNNVGRSRRFTVAKKMI